MQVRDTPPVALAAAHFAGLSLSDWAAVAGIAYTLILIAEKAYRFFNERKRK